MKLFWTYYIISGCICAFFVYKKYDEIIKDIPLMEYIPKDVLALIQFFSGFIQLPFIIPVKLHTIYLDWKLKRIKNKNKKLESRVEQLTISNSELEKKNDLLKFIDETFKKKIEEVVNAYRLDGKIDYLTFLVTENKKVLMIPMDFETTEEQKETHKQIMIRCIDCGGIAVITIGETYGELPDGTKGDYILMQFETHTLSFELVFLIDKIDKKLFKSVSRENKPFYGEFLKNLSAKEK